MVQRVYLRRSPAAFILTNETCKGYHFIGDVMNSNGIRFGIWNCGQVLEHQGGPQSVCLALAACCFAKNALPMFWGSRGLEILDWSASGWCQMLPECFPSLSLFIIAIHFHHSFFQFPLPSRMISPIWFPSAFPTSQIMSTCTLSRCPTKWNPLGSFGLELIPEVQNETWIKHV